MRTLLQNARIIAPNRIFQGSVETEDGKITRINQGFNADPLDGDLIIDLKELYLSPGFIDVHTHGAGGCDFMDGSLDAVVTACRTHLSYGTTAILPSTLCSTDQKLSDTFTYVSQAMEIKEKMPEILGLHLEGPFLSPLQSGAMNPQYIQKISKQEYERLIKLCPIIRMWTVAPELEGALEMGRWMRENNIIASIGHSDAVFEDIQHAIENGYTKVTHLFNAMSRLVRKDALMYPGVAESSLFFDDLIVEVIADGRHLPVSLLKLIYKCKGAEHICLVTDSMRAAGQDVNESIIGNLQEGQKVEIDDGVAYMVGRKSFGGSVCTADRLVRTMYKNVSVPLFEAVYMISVVPAKMMGLFHRLGSISVGKDADLLIFDDNVEIGLVMTKGEIAVNNL